jgi:cobalt-zinc-cadmium efflux system membrane fusion protein
MNRTTYAFAGLACSLLVLVSSCSRPSASPAADGGGQASALPPDAVALVRIDPSMTEAVRVAPVGLRTVPREIRTTGKVQFDEGRVARVLAPVAGQVVGLHVNVGDRVARGETLFSLNSREASAAIEEALNARHDFDLAEKTLTMTQDLFDHQAASQIALQQAATDVVKSRVRVDRTAAALTAIGLPTAEDLGRLDAKVPVTSPLAGAVIDRHLSDGQYVQPDPAPLLTIADLSTVWVEADVFERDLRLLRIGESAEVQTTAYPDERFVAKVAYVSDVLDPATRTVKVRFVVANSRLRLKPEMFATVILLVEDAEQALTVPASAVIAEGEKSFVYVAIDDRTFVRKAVEAAADAPNSRRIIRGLKAGDRVVTVGAVLLRGHEDHGAS